MSGVTLVSTPWILDMWILAIKKQHNILEAYSEHIQTFGETWSSPAKCSTYVVLYLTYQKTIQKTNSIKPASSGWGSMVRAVDFMSMSPLPHLFYCSVSSWLEALLWNTMMKGKTFCMLFPDANFDRRILYRKGKSESKVSTLPPLSQWKWFNISTCHRVSGWSPQQ